ncbi:hypothetical protein [Hymenobacter seoulensis]
MMLRRFSLLLLPLLLLLLSGLGLGVYYETNDDLAIVALLRGNTAAAPVEDLQLYFHGYAAVWSRLYQVFPAVPWYALTLYALLYAATVLLFAVLHRLLSPKIGTWATWGFLVLFFGVAWLEHGFWFNYMRVPLLLAGTGILFAAQRAPARWALAVGLVAFALAWLIRPSAAVLGALVAVPGAWWLARLRAAPVLGLAAAWALGGALWLNLTWSPAAATFRRLDVLKSNLQDFQLKAPPRHQLTASDSLALAATQQWMMADSSLVNEAVLARVAPLPSPSYFLQHIAPSKFKAVLRQVPRDYFPMLLLLAVSAGLALRLPGQHRVFGLVQLGYLVLLLGLGTILKLPPRLTLPLLDFWVLSNLAYLFQSIGKKSALTPAYRVLLMVLGVAAVPYSYKTWHRRAVLGQERAQNMQMRQELGVGLTATSVVVSDAFEQCYKAQSPFAETVLPPGKLLSVAGWPTLHPSQPALRQHLTGTRDFTGALRRLSTRPIVIWLLTPTGAAILNRQLALRAQPNTPRVWLEPKPRNEIGRFGDAQLYQMRTEFPL